MQFKKFRGAIKGLVVMGIIASTSMPLMAKMAYGDIDAGKGKGLEGQILVPYVSSDVDVLEDLDDLTEDTQITRYNIGFVGADGNGEAIWLDKEDEVDLAETMKALRQDKDTPIDFMISFGGKDVTPLQVEIQDTTRLVKVYKEVIEAYDMKAADFYMTGKGVSRTQAAERNIDALVLLQKEHKDLEIWLTFDADANGLDEDALDTIQYAKEKGLQVKGINMMVEAYGNIQSEVTKVVKGTMDAVQKDLAGIYTGLSETEVWKKLGVTPLIGENQDKISFNLEDAKEVAKYASEKQMSRVSYYDVKLDTKEDYAEAFAQVLIDQEAPSIPKGLKASFISFDQVVMEWDKSIDNNAVAGYEVTRIEKDKPENKETFKVTTNKWVDTTVKPETKYLYTLIAFDEVGNVSKVSDSLEVVTLKEGTVLKVNAINKEDVTETSVKLSWEAVKDAEYYIVYRDGFKVAETQKTEYEDKDLKEGTTYVYTIQGMDQATDPDQVLAISKAISVTTLGGEATKPEGVDKGQWKPGSMYQVGDRVTYKGKQYVCIQAHGPAAGDWFPSAYTLALWNVVPTQINQTKPVEPDKNIEGQKDNDLDANGTVWELGVQYKVGDVVLYNGKYYACIQPHTAHAEGWNPASSPALWGEYDNEAAK